MNTCDTCKHWTPPDGLDIRLHGKYHGSCIHPKLNNEDKDVEQPDWLTSWSYEGCLGSGVNVGPKFGCIHHEPR